MQKHDKHAKAEYQNYDCKEFAYLEATVKDGWLLHEETLKSVIYLCFSFLIYKNRNNNSTYIKGCWEN